MSAALFSAQNVLQDLQVQSDAEDAKNLQRFFKTGAGDYGEGDVFLGIRVPVLRKMVKHYRGIALAQSVALLQSPYHEARLLALLIMVDSFQRGDAATQQAIYQAYLQHRKYVNNWDLVDSSAHHVVGAYLHGQEKSILIQLAQSKILWDRRIAMIACFFDIKRGEFSSAVTIAELLLQDEHDLMHKAVGWMLREIGKRDLEVEIGFLQRHYQQMPRTMLRYAIEHFPESLRQAYLQGRV
ncbi:MAG: DNA alkylation repair protein [Gammaproteobacteria bacterium]|nr:DNA alkylation repair protein [Gammaproteobacteria bacterium]